MMGQIKLIATDLDGTLLDSTGKISDGNREALLEVQRQGILVTISTGRMFSSARRFASMLGIEIPLICYNGALVRRPSGEILCHFPLEMGVARRLLSYFKETNTYVQSYVDDILYVRTVDDKEFQTYVRFYGINGKQIGDALYEPKIAPTKLLASLETEADAHALMETLRDKFGDEVYITRSNVDFVEMMHPKAGKGHALKELAESLGISMDEVLAIGDGENDAEMISMAGLGIAVANATPGAKKGAKEIGPSNDEDALAWACQRALQKG